MVGGWVSTRGVYSLGVYSRLVGIGGLAPPSSRNDFDTVGGWVSTQGVYSLGVYSRLVWTGGLTPPARGTI